MDVDELMNIAKSQQPQAYSNWVGRSISEIMRIDEQRDIRWDQQYTTGSQRSADEYQGVRVDALFVWTLVPQYQALRLQKRLFRWQISFGCNNLEVAIVGYVVHVYNVGLTCPLSVHAGPYTPGV